MSIIDQSIDVKLRIDEIHPKWVICHKTGLIKRIREGKILNLGCTVQSGSSRILKLMNRFNNVEEIKNTLLLLKQANPKLHLFGHMEKLDMQDRQIIILISLESPLPLYPICLLPHMDMD